MSKPIIVKLKKDNNVYEVLTNHGMVEPFRNGKIGWTKVPYDKVNIFKDATKGDSYTDFELIKIFGSSNIDECMKIIVMEGDLQLTLADRKRKTEELKRKIVNEIHKYYLDPKTMKSHSIKLLESSIEKTKVTLSLDRPIKHQIEDIVEKLQSFIPIRKSVMEGILIIPNECVIEAQATISKFADEESKKYTDGTCEIHISVIPGFYDEFMNDINNITKGEALFIIEGISKEVSSEHYTNHTNTDIQISINQYGNATYRMS